MDQAIVDLIDNFRAYYAVFGIMLWQHNMPQVQALIAKDVSDPTANIGAYRLDGTRHAIYLKPTIDRTKTLTFNLFYMRMSMLTAITTVHDELARIGRLDASPELQLLRHLRNACAHGNRFRLNPGEPKQPAKFKKVEILPQHNGLGPVLFDFIMPGDILDLFDHIKALP